MSIFCVIPPLKDVRYTIHVNILKGKGERHPLFLTPTPFPALAYKNHDIASLHFLSVVFLNMKRHRGAVQD
jgi:hypothetical protein